jgi:hypothetical protein
MQLALIDDDGIVITSWSVTTKPSPDETTWNIDRMLVAKVLWSEIQDAIYAAS